MTVGIPKIWRSWLLPIPERRSNLGVFMEPADKMTSLMAVTVKIDVGATVAFPTKSNITSGTQGNLAEWDHIPVGATASGNDGVILTDLKALKMGFAAVVCTRLIAVVLSKMVRFGREVAFWRYVVDELLLTPPPMDDWRKPIPRMDVSPPAVSTLYGNSAS